MDMEGASALEPGIAMAGDAIGSSRLDRPPFTGGQKSTISTESTDSIRTLRGLNGTPDDSTTSLTSTAASSTTGPALGTPLATTPGTHEPFTALSPTVTPSPAKAAKHQVSRDFKNAGLIPAGGAAAPSMRAGNAPLPSNSSLSKPNIVDVAIQLQSEPGLPHWWSQVTQTLRDHFGAERATLAVATDATDVENVPWAQLATFWASDDDDLSRTVNDPSSSQSSLRDNLSPDPSGESSSSSKATVTQKLRMPGGGGIAGTHLSQPTRPKLEMRHSYAGHPPRHKHASASMDYISPGSAQKSLSPSSSMFSSFREIPSIESGLGLNEELLRYHDAQLPDGASSDVLSPSGAGRSRILQPQQPLESEADPLITSTGVLRLIGRQYATVLTREYFGGAESSTEQMPLRSPPVTPGRTEPKKSPGLSSKSHTANKHPRRRRVESSKSALSANRSGTNSTTHLIAYEDYEQFPGTPWSQSPAPSPAARGDPDENPFFSNAPDQDAFAEDPPRHKYSGHAPIPAIGIDRSRSIIQLPLIHPNARLSHTLNSRAMREDNKSKHRGTKSRSEKPSIVRHGSAPSSDITIKRVPIAILSIMATNVPFPSELIDSMNEMAPLLATSFYAARSHSNIIIELAAVAGRRQTPSFKLNMKEERTLGDMAAAAAGLNFVGSGGRARSPISPVSSASTSTQSTSTFPGNRDFGDSAAVTPGWDRFDPPSRGGDRRSPASPAEGTRDSHEDYFGKSRFRRQNSRDNLPTSPTSAARTARQASSRSKKTIHSQGATFASTQPSLPGASSNTLGAEEGVDTPGFAPDDVFREPSSSVLRTMIDNGATQQFIAEPDHGRLIWANAKFMAYRNASKDNIHEQLWSNIHHKDLHRFQMEWHRSLESGEQLSHQVRLKRFDGQHRYFHVRFLPLKDKYGVTKYWHGQAMDIHDLHEAEVKAAKSKEKAASEAKYRALANSLPVIVFAASVPTGMTFANTQWMTYSGQTLEESMGFGFLEHVHPDDLVKCRFPGVPKNPSIRNSSRKDQHKTRPGPRPIPQSDASVSSTAESEETTSTIKAFSRNAATDEPDVPSELLRGLAKDGIITWSRDQHNHLAITTEMRLKNSRGEYYWHLVQGSYIESVNFGQGEAQWFIACTDISNQKQNEAKIQQANSALEDVNTALEKEMRQKMSYLSSMSHEIRTPLNGIIGNLQFLINSGLEETASEWAHGAQEAAKNMHDLINDILDLSKAEANMLQLASHWFSPRGLMEQVLDMLNSKAAEKEIELCCECPEEMPKMIRGDSGRIRQVLLNLVGNAIKFTQIGEVIVSCERIDKVPEGQELPELGPGETFVKWTVTDTGTGFTPEDRKLLFKPYSQIKNRSTRDTGGTGLGLILCKTMVTLHGGSIDATSKPGLGSTFSFFARFKVRQDSAAKPHGDAKFNMLAPASIASAGTTPGSINPGSNSPVSRAVEIIRDSPGPLSDSSSAKSMTSTENRHSIHSSVSTADSVAPIKLILPPHPTAPRSADVALSTSTKSGELVSPIQASEPTRSSGSSSSQKSPLVSPRTIPPRMGASDLERANFRPPMVSALVVCQGEGARRITCDQIRGVVPRTVPSHVAGVATIQAALNLLHGGEPITFTHIVLRLSSDKAIYQAVQTILAEPKHDRACIVVLADQGQVKALAKIAPELDLEALSKQDRLKLAMKPAHTFKLAKIFDPFNENSLATKDPKEAKRSEEKRLQKESYALFKKVLGNKGIRVLAVEDNKLQMNILYNFLATICCLDVVKSWNGQEGLDLYKKHATGYYSVIITDIEMPIMDGLTMCRRIRDWEQEVSRPPVPVVSLSANSFAEGWSQSSSAGFSHFCPKPVQFRDLGHIILELTDPAVPHRYLSERQMPKHMLKKLGLLPQAEEDSDEEVEL